MPDRLANMLRLDWQVLLVTIPERPSMSRSGLMPGGSLAQGIQQLLLRLG